MKFEISYVYYQYLGCIWVTHWRNNLGIIKKKNNKKKKIKKEEEEEERKKKKRIIILVTLSFSLSNRISCLIKH
jgi:hypothetical protein